MSSNTINTLKLKVEQLQAKLDQLTQENDSDDDADARMESVITHISSTMSLLIREFKAYFSEFPFRLDMRNLTVVVQRPGNPVPMIRTGGGANWLAYHISALLALHYYAWEHNVPIPRFCLDSWDHVPVRSWPLFKARHGLRTLFSNDHQPLVS